MKYIKNIIVGLGACICFAAGTYMAINGLGSETWGWFLFVGIVAGAYAVKA